MALYNSCTWARVRQALMALYNSCTWARVRQALMAIILYVHGVRQVCINITVHDNEMLW